MARYAFDVHHLLMLEFFLTDQFPDDARLLGKQIVTGVTVIYQGLMMEMVRKCNRVHFDFFKNNDISAILVSGFLGV
jgi:hypothetical protein